MVPWYNEIYSELRYVTYSFLPCTVISILNIIIIVNLTLAARRRKHLGGGRGDRSMMGITVMLLLTSFTFMVLALPYDIVKAFMASISKKPTPTMTFVVVKVIHDRGYYIQGFNHAINFVLYCISGEHFRRELIAMCTIKCHRK